MSSDCRSTSMLELQREMAQLYVLSLEPLARQFDKMAAVLSTEEQARALRYRFQKDSDRFLLGRAALRYILSAYVGKSPDELEFDYGVWGKPCLRMSNGQSAVSFNASGSRELVAISVVPTGDVGVDIERVRHLDDWRLVVRSQFTAIEQEALFRLPRHRQLEAFFYAWTVKEAVLKRAGLGLRRSLDHVEVCVESLEKVAVHCWPTDTKWTKLGAVSTFEVRPLAFVALATDIQIKEVKQGDYPRILRAAAIKSTFKAEARLENGGETS